MIQDTLQTVDELARVMADAEYAQEKPGQASGYAVLKWGVQKTLDRLRAEVLLEEKATTASELSWIAQQDDASLERAL